MSFWDRFRNNNNKNKNRPSGNPRGNLKGRRGAPKQPVYNPLSGGSANTGRRVVRRQTGGTDARQVGRQGAYDRSRAQPRQPAFSASAATNPNAPGFWATGQTNEQDPWLPRAGNWMSQNIPGVRATTNFLTSMDDRLGFTPERQARNRARIENFFGVNQPRDTQESLHRFLNPRLRNRPQVDPSLRVTNPYDQTPPAYSGDVRQGRNPNLGGQPQLPSHLQQLQTLLGRPGQNRPYAFGGDTRQGSVPQPGQLDTSAPRASLDVRQGNPNVLGAGLASPQNPQGVARPGFPGGANQPGVAARSDVRGTNPNVVNPYAQGQRGDDWASQFAHLLQGQAQTDWGGRSGDVREGAGLLQGQQFSDWGQRPGEVGTLTGMSDQYKAGLYTQGGFNPYNQAAEPPGFRYDPLSSARIRHNEQARQFANTGSQIAAPGPAAPVTTIGGGGRQPLNSEQIQGILDKYKTSPGGNVQLTPEDRESILHTLNSYRFNQFSSPGGGQPTQGGVNTGGEPQTDDWGGQINPGGGAGPGGIDPAPGPGLDNPGFATSPEELPLTQQQLMQLYRNSLSEEERAQFDARYFTNPTEDQYETFRAQLAASPGTQRVEPRRGRPIYNLIPYAGFGGIGWGGAYNVLGHMSYDTAKERYKSKTVVSYLEDCFKELQDERNNQEWDAHWCELRRFILPRSGQNNFTYASASDEWNDNYGGGINNDIINDVAGHAIGIIASGLMSGITNPTMKWFALELPEQYEGNKEERKWLSQLEKTLRDTFLVSNFYKVLPRVYEDLAVYGTAALGVFDHEETDLRFEHYPIGTYWISQDHQYNVNKFFRTQNKTADNIVNEFATTEGRLDKRKYRKLSSATRSNYEMGNKESRTEVMEAIVPMEYTKFSGRENLRHQYETEDGKKDFPFVRIIYERQGADTDDMSGGGESANVIHKGGFHMFPILVPRWYFRTFDVYGRSPGMSILPTVKQLQGMEKTKYIGLQKMINPPLQTHTHLGDQNTDTDAGAVNYITSANLEGGDGLTPIYSVSPSLNHFTAEIEKIEAKINRMLYTGLFEAISNINKSNATATEINAIQNEKFLQLGPVLTSLEDDLLKPLVDISVYRLQDRGLIEEPPKTLMDTRFTPKYISIVAMALMGRSREVLTMFENLSSDMAVRQANMGQSDNVADIINYDEVLRAYAEQLRIDPSMLKSEREVKRMREERQRMRQMQEQMARQIEAQQVQEPSRSPSIARGLAGG